MGEGMVYWEGKRGGACTSRPTDGRSCGGPGRPACAGTTRARSCAKDNRFRPALKPYAANAPVNSGAQAPEFTAADWQSCLLGTLLLHRSRSCHAPAANSGAYMLQNLRSH